MEVVVYPELATRGRELLESRFGPQWPEVELGKRIAQARRELKALVQP
jgi:hypothetical protein